MTRDRFFKAFLIIYVGFLVVHSISLDWDSWMVPVALALGLGVAALAHTRYGILTIGLLLVHMGLEWAERARHGWHYSPGEIALHAVHACLDFTFLYQELRMHARRYHKPLFTGITACLILLFMGLYTPAPRSPFLLAAMRFHTHQWHKHGHGSSPIEPFVMGGMFGCIMSHLLSKRRV